MRTFFERMAKEEILVEVFEDGDTDYDLGFILGWTDNGYCMLSYLQNGGANGVRWGRFQNVEYAMWDTAYLQSMDLVIDRNALKSTKDRGLSADIEEAFLWFYSSGEIVLLLHDNEKTYGRIYEVHDDYLVIQDYRYNGKRGGMTMLPKEEIESLISYSSITLCIEKLAEGR